MKLDKNTYLIPNSNNLEAESLVDICMRREKLQPHQLAYRFLANGIDESDLLTYRDLHVNSTRIANALKEYSHEQGNVLLLYPSGLEYISAFFGCLYAEAIAVPAYPIMAQEGGQRLRSIIRDSNPSVILTLQSHYKSIDHWLHKEGLSETIKIITTDNLNSVHQEIAVKNKQPIAFLQYTSGSTGNPKGVIVSHKNLLHNLQQIYIGFSHNAKSEGVIWLPPYHDMGLIGGLLQPMYGGFPVNIMSPMTFLRRPTRWLQAIHRYRATSSGGPNFAYDLCIKYAKSKNIQNLDLSSWNVAFTGAEAIRNKTLNEFYNAYKKYGFEYEVFYPCYGLAESSLIVTGNNRKQQPITLGTTHKCLQQGKIENCYQDNRINLIGSGAALDADLQIVDPETLSVLDDKNIGEIWVKSKSVAQGYWKNIKQTKYIFGAYTQNNKGPYMRTGDLGFLSDKQLYVTGRLKELIIINGQNYFPNDVEEVVQNSSQLSRKGSGTAFSVDVKGKERLIIVQEIERKELTAIEKMGVEDEIKKNVSNNFKIIPYDIILVKKSALPKTTSGKLKRLEIKRRYLNGRLKKEIISNCQKSTDTSLDHPMINFKLFETNSEIEFEGVIEKELLKNYSLHRLNNQSLVPGAAYIDAAGFIGNYLYGMGNFSLNQFSINNPCYINRYENKPISLNYQLKRHHNDGWSLRINKILNDDSFEFLSRCTIQRTVVSETTATYEASESVISVDELYQSLEDHGFSYGDMFRRVEKVEITKSGIRGFLKSENTHSTPEKFVLNPYVVDAGFQLFATSPEVQENDNVYLPVSIGKITQIKSVTENMICFVDNIRHHRNMLIADVLYSDIGGDPIIKLNCVKLMAQTKVFFPEKYTITENIQEINAA